MCALATTVACGDTTAPAGGDGQPAVALFDAGQLVVWVYFDGEGVAGKRLEVLEKGIVRKTSDSGYARFSLPAGDYTLRAYDINRGGPALRYIDTPFIIRAGEVTRIEIFDCLPCV